MSSNCGTITVAGRILNLESSQDLESFTTLYVVGNPIISDTPWGGGVTQCTRQEIQRSVCEPPDKRWNLYGTYDGVNPQEGIRVFGDYEEGFSRISSCRSGKGLLTRHGVPLVKIRVPRSVLIRWNVDATALPETTSGFWLPYFPASEVHFLTAEFKGSYFAPVRLNASTCVIL